MGRISDEDIVRVRDSTDLVALVSERVVLRQKGRLFWGNCPFHGEKTPSFKIDPGTQLWHCFGCGAGGDAFGYVMRSDSVEFPDAVRLLAERANVEITEAEGGVPRGHKERIFAAMAQATEYYQRVLTGSRDPGATGAREYLASRGFGSDVAKRWSLGYAPRGSSLTSHLRQEGFTVEEMVQANLALRPDKGSVKDRFYDRIIFPIMDLQGRPIAFGGRIVGAGEPKYLNTNDTPVFHKSASLYGIDRAKGSITAGGGAVVVEGYTDVIALHEAGMTNVVATLGTALTRQHVKLLGRFASRIVYLFDGDDAGLRAADRAAEFVDSTATPEAGSSRVTLDVAVLPEGMDPADLVSAEGAQALLDIVGEAVPLLEFAIDRRLARWDLEKPEERSRALRDAAAVLAPVRGSTLASDYAMRIADRLSASGMPVRVDQVLAAIPAVTARITPEEPEAPVPAAALGPISSPRDRVERDLLGLLVSVPTARNRAQELLTDSLVSEGPHLRIAQLIAGSPTGVSPRTLMGEIETEVPGAAEALSGASSDEGDLHETELVVADLIRRLKELEIERRIAIGRAQLNSPEIVKDRAISDEILREVSALQVELDALRRDVRMN